MTSTCDDSGSAHSKYFPSSSSGSEGHPPDPGHQEPLSHGEHPVTQFAAGHKHISPTLVERQRHESQKSSCSDMTSYPTDDFRRLLTGGESDGVTTVEEWFKIYRQANSKLLNTYSGQAYSEDRSSHSSFSDSSHEAKHTTPLPLHSEPHQKHAQFLYADPTQNIGQRISASAYADTRHGPAPGISESAYSDIRHTTGDRMAHSAYPDARQGTSLRMSESAYSEVGHTPGERVSQSAYIDPTQGQTVGESVAGSVHRHLGYNKDGKRPSSSYSKNSDSGKSEESALSNVDEQTGEKRPRYVNSKFSSDGDQKMSQVVNSGSGSLMKTDSANALNAKQPSGSEEGEKGDNLNETETVPACWVCHEKFSKMSNLIRHVKTHDEGQGHQCHVCGRRFTRGDSLIRHSRIHTGIKPYTCTLCGRSFTMSGSLKSHTLVHTKERRYKCDVCLKTFSRSDTLSRHSQTHVTESSLECGICTKKFRNATVLRCHVQRHMEDEKKLTCFDCDKVFSRPDSLARHKQSHCIKITVSKRSLETRMSKVGSFQKDLKVGSTTQGEALSLEGSMKQNSVSHMSQADALYKDDKFKT